MSTPNVPAPAGWTGPPTPMSEFHPNVPAPAGWTQPPAPMSGFDPNTKPFRFDGGAGSYVGMSILAGLLTAFTLGIAYPWALCMRYRWKAQHTLVYGRRVHFTGSGIGLFGTWIKWLLLCIITLGLYGFWVIPRLTRWITEHQDFN